MRANDTDFGIFGDLMADHTVPFWMRYNATRMLLRKPDEEKHVPLFDLPKLTEFLTID